MISNVIVVGAYCAAMIGAVRPLLFLDVDGPLIPFGMSANQPLRHDPRPHVESNPLLARLDPTIGPRLLALPCDLVWATTWMADANQVIAPRIGLPELPIAQWPDEDDEHGALHWKTRGLVTWAAGRSFGWVDDEITDPDRAWISMHHSGHALPHRVDACPGLTEADLNDIGQWLDRIVAD